MAAELIDGKATAAGLRARIGRAVADLKAAHQLTPGLAVVLVGDDPASQVYVRNKGLATKEAGMNSFEFRLPEDTPEEDVLAKIADLNEDPRVHGVLVQFPVPPQVSQQRVIEAVLPEKDVDGLNPVNAGRLASGLEAPAPCTPQGCVLLARQALGLLEGLHAVVVGRSNLVGKPAAQLLLRENCTVTMAHSRTQNLPELCKTADILVAAVGQPEMVKGGWIRPGACVIDVGINRVAAPEKGGGKTRLVGDVDFTAAAGIAGHITPVPGGVGPMTIACLLKNTLDAACAQTGVDPVKL